MINKQQRYAQRILRVSEYIQQHLDETLDVERLSRVANFSKFHFHRIFQVVTGINVYKYIQLQRLRRSAQQLAYEPELRIIDIAYRANFENPESFSRAFKQLCGQTPSQFRRQPCWQVWQTIFQQAFNERLHNMKVDIIDFKPTRIAVLEHLGAPSTVEQSVEKFRNWRKSTGLSPVKTHQSYGLIYADPETTPAHEFRFDICGEVDAEVPENPFGIMNKLIPGGRCAVTRHIGAYSHLGPSVYYLYGQWLPASGEELRDFPCFFHYTSIADNLPEHKQITDIYLPLK